MINERTDKLINQKRNEKIYITKTSYEIKRGLIYLNKY